MKTPAHDARRAWLPALQALLPALLCVQLLVTPSAASAPDSAHDLPPHRFDARHSLLLVERDGQHIRRIEERNLTTVQRLSIRRLHGRPLPSPDGRYLYTGSMDGWVSKYDLHTAALVAEQRLGKQPLMLSLSADGRYLLAAETHALSLLDAGSLQPIKTFTDKLLNDIGAGISALHTAPPRNSFFVALQNAAEIWEINYADRPPPGFAGWVHDFHPESGDEVLRRFPLRRLRSHAPLTDIGFDWQYEHLFGSSADAGLQIIDLYIGRRVAAVHLPAGANLAAASAFCHRGRPVLAIPDPNQARISLVDMQDWSVIQHFKTAAPVSFIRTHAALATLWLSMPPTPGTGTLQLVDKDTLAPVAPRAALPDMDIADIVFTTDGRQALVSFTADGAVPRIYDTHSLIENGRSPLPQPAAIYSSAPTPASQPATLCDAPAATAH